MADMANVCLTGRMVRDATTKKVGQTSVTEFTLAVNSWKKDDTGNHIASFCNIEVWGKLGEIIIRYGVKGKQLAISGEVRIDTWEKEGVKQRKTVIDAKNITLLGSKDEAPVKVAIPNAEIPF